MEYFLSGSTRPAFEPVITGAILFYAPSFAPTLLPSRNYLSEQKSELRGNLWDPWPQNPYYDNAEKHSSEDMQNLMIIQQFASTLIANLQDLDPEISKKVNEDFWNLV